eukprot:3177848-Rhodomonas_salina.2
MLCIRYAMSGTGIDHTLPCCAFLCYVRYWSRPHLYVIAIRCPVLRSAIPGGGVKRDCKRGHVSHLPKRSLRDVRY